ncbi:transmembrane protein 132C-like [Anguilla rostrata]|uniref:transmembrane protein 132C-like n=1 Tax=Anguilla rostrata TaxID=7938 RepID=UPI0030CF2805
MGVHVVLAQRALLKSCCLLAIAHAQLPPFSPSLPAKISVPPPWRALPLSQPDLGLLFSNSSPFSCSQSLLVVPPAGASSRPGVQASFGPYFISQPIPSSLPLSPPLTASLLSKAVERERGGERGPKFRVRVLFHWRGAASRGCCVTLHAFKETEEQRASCSTQAPLGLCIISLSLPEGWFTEERRQGWSHRQTHKLHYRPRHRHRNRGRRHWDTLSTPRSKPSHSTDSIKLYYSSSTISAPKLSPSGCMEDKLQQSQRRLHYIGAVTLPDRTVAKNMSEEELGCSDGQEEEELCLDPNVLIGYRRGPVRAGRPIGVSVSVRSNFTGDFVVIRLRVKKGFISVLAQPSSAASEFWSVSLERSTGSRHDIITVICLKSARGQKGSFSPSVLHQVACFSLDGLERSFGVAMTVAVHWWVEYSGRNNPLPPHEGVVSTFSFTDREIVGIAPITESNTIINTAILNSQPVSLPVIVLAVGHDGEVSDVTAAVTCRSANEDIVKVSSDCSTLFVDGSESGVGSTCVGVEYHLGTLRGAHCLSVWTPAVPLLVALSDPVLNAVEGWTQHSEGRCSPVYQRSAVQVLAQFAAQPPVETGQLTYMLGSPDWFMDVTELVRDWLLVENPRVAELDERTYLIGLQPGVTSLRVVSSQWDGVLGSCDVTVTADHVTPGDLSVQLVGGLSLSVTANPTHPSVVTATAMAHNILYSHGQEAAFSVWLQFSDETATLVSAFDPAPYSLRLSSLADTVVTVTPGPTQRVVAQGDGGGPLLRAELLVSTCPAQKQAANERGGGGGGGGGGGIKRLASGSGWVRVKLDWELHPDSSEEPGFQVLEISQVFPDSESELYEPSNSSRGYGQDREEDDEDEGVDGGRDSSLGAGTRTHLERAVLTPSHDGGGVYLHPSKDTGGGGERELEVGVGAMLSLLCLSALLFLANFLPCALRKRGKRRRRERGGQGPEEEEHREKAGDGEKGGEETEERMRSGLG